MPVPADGGSQGVAAAVPVFLPQLTERVVMAEGVTPGSSERAAGSSSEAGEAVDGGNEGSSSAESGASSPESHLCAAVVTISSTRTIETDESSRAVVSALDAAGHVIATRERIDTSHDTVQGTVSRLIDRDDVDFVVTAGATGVDPTDVTIEAVRPILGRELFAFSELFTVLAYERIGTRVVSGRTLAGVTDGVLVFCLPGHPDAARLAVEEIVLPEIRHLVAEATGENERPAGADEGTDDADGDASGVDDVAGDGPDDVGDC